MNVEKSNELYIKVKECAQMSSKIKFAASASKKKIFLFLYSNFAKYILKICIFF